MDYIDKYGRPLIGFVLFAGSILMKFFGQKSHSIRFLMSSHRISNGKLRLVNRLVVRNREDVLEESLLWVNKRDNDPRTLEMALGRTIILKKPVEQSGVVTEKGVFLITFTDSCDCPLYTFDAADARPG